MCEFLFSLTFLNVLHDIANAVGLRERGEGECYLGFVNPTQASHLRKGNLN